MYNRFNMRKIEDARIAYQQAAEALAEAKNEFGAAVYEEVRDRGPLNSVQLAKTFGCDLSTIRALMRKPSRWSSTIDTKCGPLNVTHTRVEQKYALLNEDGSVDTTQTIRQVKQVRQYSLYR